MSTKIYQFCLLQHQTQIRTSSLKLQYNFIQPSIVAALKNVIDHKYMANEFLAANVRDKTINILFMNDTNDQPLQLNNSKGSGSHWSLLIFDSKSGFFFYYNSLQTPEFRYNNTNRILNGLHLDVFAKVCGFENQIHFYNVNCVLQENGSDCGIYVYLNLMGILSQHKAQNSSYFGYLGNIGCPVRFYNMNNDGEFLKNGTPITSALAQEIRHLFKHKIVSLSQKTIMEQPQRHLVNDIEKYVSHFHKYTI